MRNPVILFLCFLILVIVLRFYAFFYSATGWDESLYILMSRSLLEGHPLYTEIWDNKPPGIYLIFAFALKVFGNSVLSIRILTCLIITITCCLLYKLGNIISQNRQNLGLIAGVLYAVFTLTNSGIESNTELFYIPLVTLAFYLLFRSQNYFENLVQGNNLTFLLIGLLMGLAWQIKPVIIFDFSAVFLITGIEIYRQNNVELKSCLIKITKSYALLFIGFILPAIITALYFISQGWFERYVYANFTANIIRSSVDPFSFTRLFTALGRQIGANFILWYCLVATPFYLLASRIPQREEKKNLVYLLIWFCLDFPAVLYTKSYYNYYFLQLFPSQCLLSSYIILETFSSLRRKPITQQQFLLLLPIGIGLLLSLYPIAQTFYKSSRFIYFRYVKGVDYWGDTPAIVSKYIRQKITPGDFIYVVDYQPIIYFLTQARVPTKYAGVPGFLLGSFVKFSASQPLKELEKIMSQNRPIYVVKKIEEVDTFDKKYYAQLDKYLQEKYILETSIDDVNLYRIKMAPVHH